MKRRAGPERSPRVAQHVARMLLLLVLTGLVFTPVAAAVDSDMDGVDDVSDNCVQNVNPHQEDSDADGTGDVCDADTINALLEPDTSGLLHARTPSYRMRFGATDGLEIAPEDGVGSSPRPSIYPPDPIIGLSPVQVTGLVVPYAAQVATALSQSTWQTAVARSRFVGSGGPGGVPDLDVQISTHANGVSMGYEIPLSLVPAGNDVEVLHLLTLPTGWTLTDDAGVPVGTPAVRHLTFVDETGTSRIRLGAVELLAFGSETTIEDSSTFFGLARLADELDPALETATAGPPDLVGSNAYGGIHAPLVETSYTLRENFAEGALGETRIAAGGGNLLVVIKAPAAFLDRNRASSSTVFLGLRLSSLTPIDLGTGSSGASAPPVHGRHIVFFDDAASVTGAHVDVRMHNALGTFDGRAPDYDLLPNAGGTAALYDAASQQQTGFGCSGCDMTLLGDSRIEFVGGGVGVAIAPGPRVHATHACLVSDPLDLALGTGRCAAGSNKRASFQAESLTIVGSMSGLVGAESDLLLDELVFQQGPDPNVTDPTLLQAVMGLGCAADAGPRIGINPSNDDLTGNVPFDLASCSTFLIGQAACIPAPLAQPATTGLCNLEVDRVELYGMGSIENPIGTDLTLPSGDGLALHMRSGRGRIGDLAYDAMAGECVGTLATEPSSVRGFEALASLSGGANVRAGTAEPLAADDAEAVPPNAYCLTNILGDELGMGLVVAGNVDVRAKYLQIEGTLGGSMVVGNATANVEDVTTTGAQGAPCRSVDAETCASPVQELACPFCKPNESHYLATVSSGRSAPTHLTVTHSVLGMDSGGPRSGGNPALPALALDADLAAIGGGLTIGRRPAGLFGVPVQIALGPDTMFDPNLFSLTLRESNVGVVGAALSIDNFDSAGGLVNLALEDNCYSTDGTTCLGSGASTAVVASAAPASAVGTLNAAALMDAAASPNPDAGIQPVPEPSLAIGLLTGAAGVGVCSALRRRRR